MRPSPILLALLAVVAVAGAAAWAYERARPWVHPIKAADERRYGLERGSTAPARSAPADPRRPLFGPATVIDGDTLAIAGIEADLWTIDAPEPDQTCEDAQGRTFSCGQAARANLERLIGGRNVACRPEGPPPDDGRWLGLCFVSDTPCDAGHGTEAVGACASDLSSLNLTLVETGWAVDLEGQYADPQDAARGRKAGLWAGRFEPPSTWRGRGEPSRPAGRRDQSPAGER